MTPRPTLIALLVAVLTLVFGPIPTAAADPAPQADGTPLYDATSMYPRAIRLQHGTGQGQILATATTFTERGGEVAVFRSTDNGASFSRVALIPAAQGFGERERVARGRDRAANDRQVADAVDIRGFVEPRFPPGRIEHAHGLVRDRWHAEAL